MSSGIIADRRAAADLRAATFAAFGSLACMLIPISCCVAAPAVAGDSQLTSSQADAEIGSLLDKMRSTLLDNENLPSTEVMTMLFSAEALIPLASPQGKQIMTEFPGQLRTQAKQINDDPKRAANLAAFADIAAQYLDLSRGGSPGAKPAATAAVPLPHDGSVHLLPSSEQAGGVPVPGAAKSVAKEPAPEAIAATSPVDPRPPPRPSAGPAASEANAGHGSVAPGAAPVANRETPPSPAASNVVTLERPAERPPDPILHLSAAEQRQLLKRADAMLGLGEIPAARMLLERVAHSGVAAAALTLAKTYDGAFLSQHRLLGIRPDPAKADEWYSRARALGAGRPDADQSRIANATEMQSRQQ